MRWAWVRGGRCATCRRRWRLLRVARPANAVPTPMQIKGRAPWTEAPDPGPDDRTRFDLIRRHPFLRDLPLLER